VRAQQAPVLCSFEKMTDLSVRYSIHAQQVGQKLLTMRLPQGDGLPNVCELFFVFRSELVECEADPRDV